MCPLADTRSLRSRGRVAQVVYALRYPAELATPGVPSEEAVRPRTATRTGTAHPWRQAGRRRGPAPGGAAKSTINGLEPRGPKAAEPEAVCDDEDGREGHRGTGEQRVQQPGGGEREGGDVVGEGPEQVAADGAERGVGEPDCVRRGSQVSAHESEVAGGDRHVGAGTHGDAEIGGGQR